MNNTKTYGLTHVAIKVKDIDRTARFYQQVLDMEVMYHEKDFVQLTTPGCHDILVFEKTEEHVVKNGGIAHFGFRLRKPEDIGFMKDKIIRAGGEIVDEGEFVPGSPYIFFKDPDGYVVEIWFEVLQGS
jgi:catechol-2,3-dioxygenase